MQLLSRLLRTPDSSSHFAQYELNRWTHLPVLLSLPNTRLLPHCLRRLCDQLLQVAVSLCELLCILVLDVLLGLGRPVSGDHDHTRGSLGCACFTKLRARLDVDVWNTVVFAQNGNVRDDIHWRDVGSDDDNCKRVGRV